LDIISSPPSYSISPPSFNPLILFTPLLFFDLLDLLDLLDFYDLTDFLLSLSLNSSLSPSIPGMIISGSYFYSSFASIYSGSIGVAGASVFSSSLAFLSSGCSSLGVSLGFSSFLVSSTFSSLGALLNLFQKEFFSFSSFFYLSLCFLIPISVLLLLCLS
jgi:hypothetical protein